jgi:hypothetical protein
LVHLYLSSSLLPCPLPMVALSSLRYLYSFMYCEHINHPISFSIVCFWKIYMYIYIYIFHIYIFHIYIYFIYIYIYIYIYMNRDWTLGLGLTLLIESHLQTLHFYVCFFSLIGADPNPSQVCHFYFFIYFSMLGCFGFIYILFPWFLFFCFVFVLFIDWLLQSRRALMLGPHLQLILSAYLEMEFLEVFV